MKCSRCGENMYAVEYSDFNDEYQTKTLVCMNYKCSESFREAGCPICHSMNFTIKITENKINNLLFECLDCKHLW